jgi:hypothetical protein
MIALMKFCDATAPSPARFARDLSPLGRGGVVPASAHCLTSPRWGAVGFRAFARKPGEGAWAFPAGRCPS